MTILFVRHGESVANTLRIVSNRDLPHPLTDKGVEQAETLATKLQDRQVAKIYSSPVPRAKQTAEILAAKLGSEVEISTALREYDCGELEGKGDDETWRKHSQVIDAWFNESQFGVRSHGGESFLDIEARFVPFIEELRGRHRDGETVVLVGHGGTYRAMLPIVTENVSFTYVKTAPMPNTVVIEAVWTPTGFRCLWWDDRII